MKYTVIKTDKQYNVYCDLLEEFEDNNLHNSDEFELLDLLTEIYENQVIYPRMGLDKQINPIELIKLCMENHKMNTRGLADKLTKSEGYVSDILNKKKAISKNVALQVAKLFAIQLDALLRPYALVNKKQPQKQVA